MARRRLPGAGGGMVRARGGGVHEGKTAMMNPHEAVAEVLNSHRYAYLSGPNFSARSEVLQHATHLPVEGPIEGCDSYGNRLPGGHNEAGDRFAYVGPEVYQSFSGLAS